MSDLVERLREQVKRTADATGCDCRTCPCDCGFDLTNEGLLEMAADEIERLRCSAESVRHQTIEECALIAEGFDASCDSPRMKLFVDAGLVMAIYKRDGEIGAAIRTLAALAAPQSAESVTAHGSATAKRAERTAPVLIATHNIGEGLPSGDAAGAGAVLAADLAQSSQVSPEKMLDLLQCSTCFRGDVCHSMPCACAKSLADAAQGSTRDFDNAHIDDQFYVDFSRNRDGSPKMSDVPQAAPVTDKLMSTKFDEVSCEKPGDGCEWPECECRRKELRGTFACPICGKDTPHHHASSPTTDLVKRLRNFCIWNNRHSHYDPVPVCQEAADEIERLLRALPQTVPLERAKNDELVKALQVARHAIWIGGDTLRAINTIDAALVAVGGA